MGEKITTCLYLGTPVAPESRRAFIQQCASLYACWTASPTESFLLDIRTGQTIEIDLDLPINSIDKQMTDSDILFVRWGKAGISGSISVQETRDTAIYTIAMPIEHVRKVGASISENRMLSLYKLASEKCPCILMSGSELEIDPYHSFNEAALSAISGHYNAYWIFYDLQTYQKWIRPSVPLDLDVNFLDDVVILRRLKSIEAHRLN